MGSQSNIIVNYVILKLHDQIDLSMDQVEFECHFLQWELIMCIFPSFPLPINSFFFFFTHFCQGDARNKILYFECIFYNMFWENFNSYVKTQPIPFLHLARKDHLSVPNGFYFRSEFYQAVLEFDCSWSSINKHCHTSGISRVVTSGKIMFSSFLFISMHPRVNYLSTPDVILARVKY